MLWKKDANGLHTNIFANKRVTPSSIRKCQKNNDISTKFRQLGNARFVEKDWRDAMVMYNNSLRFAEINTDNVGLAYANRSTCFLKLEMYDKCLVDTELAIKSNYPQNKIEKLEERQVFCLERIKNANSDAKGGPTLDFEADENFPGMANVLQMECNKEFGRHFVAKCDIDVGKTIVVDEAFVTTHMMQGGLNICSACFKNATNFIACTNCTEALFCDQSCAEHDLHKIECNNVCSHDSIIYFTRSIVRAISMFDDVKDLMEFVMTVVNEKSGLKDAPRSIADMKSKYRLFLELNLWLSDTEKSSMIDRGAAVFEILMKMSEVKTKFSTQNQKRFLMHLCVMHAYIVLSNSFQKPVNGGIYLLLNHFNHSCAPNALKSLYENKAVVITSRRIKKGDQVFISYGKKYFQTMVRDERQQALYKDFGFWCKCEKCENKNWPTESLLIQNDPKYQSLWKEVRFNDLEVFQKDRAKCSKVKQGFLDLLIKYSNLAWCGELEMAAFWYQELSMESTF